MTESQLSDSPTDAVDAIEHGEAAGTAEVAARVVLFGFPPSDVVVRIRPRSNAWRVGGAIRTLALFVVIAPVVAIVPPHAPWPIGALLGGAILSRRRLGERFTLERIDGVCPKCSTPLRVKRGRLRAPHPISCETCHHESALTVPVETLAEVAAEVAAEG